MIPVFIKEINSFLNSLMGYLVIAVFLVAMGLLMWVFPETSVLEYGYAEMGTLFSTGPYVLIFLVPAITMRSFAEERKLGTLDLLMTKPVTETGVVMGKFLAAFALVVLSVLPTVVYYFALSSLANPFGNIDTPGVIGSYIGLVLLGGVFCTIGLFASSISTNQIVSFILAAFFCFLFYTGFDAVSSLFADGSLALIAKQWGILYHYESLSKGLIDSRDLVYFISLGGVWLLAAKTVLSSRTW
ncbi:MAG: gliding motility-associated ABC transporter permease subunit GldF [Cyclobacteriaceae bacterium]|jgi:ABC-2 type transport system permease protein|nr:gliding motility-associated ABC transporter permease subunit GldF [Cytophagales bacterium]HNP76028.1 gliding motility-associated ABC transporter permease subunit GldF [Cyclobacteriaceae bacterium]